MSRGIPNLLERRRLVLGLDHGVGGSVELLVSLQERQRDDEEVLEGLGAGGLDELAGSSGRSARGDQVAAVSRGHLPFVSFPGPRTLVWAAQVHSLEDDDRLARLDRILLHLELVDSVLLLVLGDVASPGQLAGLADGHKGRADAESDDRAEEESSGIEADDDVGGRSREFGEDVVHKVGDELFEGGRGAEQREDVEEGDSLG